jgi:hypothetical protein
VSPLDDSAAAWCARGAVYRVVGGDIPEFWRAVRALEQASQALYGASICAVNEGPPAFAHEAVLGAFDHAVDALGLARQAYALATSPSDKRADVLGILGLMSHSSRQASCVDLTGVDPGTGDSESLMEQEHVASITART